MKQQRIDELRGLYRQALLDDVVPFWQRHGVDHEQGGFFTYLERDGSLYGTDKPVWLQGRATWLFATLHARVEPRDEWLALARHGHAFLTAHCFDARGKMYFLVDRGGRPLRMRRYVFSEVFGILALAALAQATGEDHYRSRAHELFNAFHTYITTPNGIEPKTAPQTRPMKGLAPLMCLVSVADALAALGGAADAGRLEGVIDDCIAEIFRDFVKLDDECVLETVAPDGGRIDAPDGRVMSPGHAIETAWFLMEVGRRRGDRDLVERSTRVLDVSFERGWDRDCGGLLYFVDVDGKPSAYLEHDMKLWWPHCEALYAALLAHHLTGDARYADMYEQVHAYAFERFPDAEHGEWFGYLRRDGTRSLTCKGGTWKGAFHVPRALLYCWELLKEMRGAG